MLETLNQLDQEAFNSLLANEHPQTIALILLQVSEEKKEGFLEMVDSKLREELEERMGYGICISDKRLEDFNTYVLDEAKKVSNDLK